MVPIELLRRVPAIGRCRPQINQTNIIKLVTGRKRERGFVLGSFVPSARSALAVVSQGIFDDRDSESQHQDHYTVITYGTVRGREKAKRRFLI